MDIYKKSLIPKINMSYKIIIYMTLPKECSICYESFIMPADIEESIHIHKQEVIDKADHYIKINRVAGKTNRNIIIKHFLIKYYQKLWYPHYKQYKCSTENCNTYICGTCMNQIECKSDDIVFRCTHCRLFDWKSYMTKYVFPELIMIYLSTTCKNRVFSLKEFANVGYMV